MNLTGADMPAWYTQALCAQTDPEAFFPISDGKHRDTNNTREAIATCRQCPVTTKCLDYAITNREEWGIWGGMLPSQRRKVREAAA